MCFARALMPAFTDDPAIARDHAAYARIGMRRREAALGQFQCPRHRGAIE
jgi:hypothetical protein